MAYHFFFKSSMKRAEMTLDFQRNNANAFREKIALIKTSSEHYAIPLTKTKQVITIQHSAATPQVTLYH